MAVTRPRGRQVAAGGTQAGPALRRGVTCLGPAETQFFQIHPSKAGNAVSQRDLAPCLTLIRE